MQEKETIELDADKQQHVSQIRWWNIKNKKKCQIFVEAENIKYCTMKLKIMI